MIILNSSLVKEPSVQGNARLLPIPMNDIAQELGEVRAANMVALGAVVKVLGLFPLEAAAEALAKELGARGREKLLEVNRQALWRGFALA